MVDFEMRQTIGRDTYNYSRDYYERTGRFWYAYPLRDGFRASVRTLQQLLGVSPDGFIGPQTVEAAYAAGVPIFPLFWSERYAVQWLAGNVLGAISYLRRRIA